MSDVMIRVENLGKKYMIGHQAEGRSNYVALRDVLADGAKALVKRFTGRDKGDRRPTQEEFWALKDVSFEVKRGECVGIIGRNGAGKSTLLKILSRITEPTTGRVQLHGRVASLLEVGTGFHPELTGRENIYLNGAILGMTRREIKAKFDEIVDFAEVEKFLDTPVKRYSSGMYVRLAFAVAAHLEPEILVVDEVLAVGDAAFQKKCLGKMGDVAEKEGRTVLFVSHNMATIKTLCSKGIHLKEGKLSSQNDIEKVINDYSNTQQGNQVIYLANKVQETPYIKKIYISQADNTRSNIFAMDQPIIIEIETKNHRNNELVIGVVIRNSQGMLIHHSSNEFRDKNAYELTNNSLSRITKCIIPPYALSSGQYSADFVVAERNYELFEKISDALTFEVEFTGKVSEKTTANDWKGVCAPGILLWI